MSPTPRELLRELARQTIPPERAEFKLGRRIRVVRRLERFGAIVLSRTLGTRKRRHFVAGRPTES